MANWALVILTLGLVTVTFWYMRHTKRLADDTKRMADMMVREFELRVAPLIAIDQLSTTTGKNLKTYAPIICNKGPSAVTVNRIVLRWWYKDSPSKTYRQEAPIDKTLGKGEFTKLGQYSITLKKGDMVKDDYQPSKDLELAQLLPLVQGGIYCVCTDASGGERMTGELRTLQTL